MKVQNRSTCFLLTLALLNHCPIKSFFQKSGGFVVLRHKSEQARPCIYEGDVIHYEYRSFFTRVCADIFKVRQYTGILNYLPNIEIKKVVDSSTCTWSKRHIQGVSEKTEQI